MPTVWPISPGLPILAISLSLLTPFRLGSAEDTLTHLLQSSIRTLLVLDPCCIRLISGERTPMVVRALQLTLSVMPTSEVTQARTTSPQHPEQSYLRVVLMTVLLQRVTLQATS